MSILPIERLCLQGAALSQLLGEHFKQPCRVEAPNASFRLELPYDRIEALQRGDARVYALQIDLAGCIQQESFVDAKPGWQDVGIELRKVVYGYQSKPHSLSTGLYCMQKQCLQHAEIAKTWD